MQINSKETLELSEYLKQVFEEEMKILLSSEDIEELEEAKDVFIEAGELQTAGKLQIKIDKLKQ